MPCLASGTYTPRPYQIPVFNAFDEKGIRRILQVWHRRAGKDVTDFNFMLGAAVNKVAAYYYMFPALVQARRAMWDAPDSHSGLRMIDHVPAQLIANIRKNDMVIELVNGSVIQFLGADNYDKNIGTPPLGIVFSEYSLTNPRAWAYYAPILAENKGWAIFNYTPRGPNHAKELYDSVRDNPDWFVSLLTVNDTGAVDPEEINRLRTEGVSEEEILQEFYCSFSAGMAGAYYARILEEIRQKGQVGHVRPDPNLPVFTSWDLGMADPTGIWFLQMLPRAREVRALHYYELTGEPMTHYINYAREWAARNRVTLANEHAAPHDINVREYTSGTSRREVARNLGWNFTPVANLPLMDAIDATRRLLPLFWFDEEGCKFGIQALNHYHCEKNTKYKSWRSTPVHDWSSHGATAFQTFAIHYQSLILREEANMLLPTSENMKEPRKKSGEKYVPSFKRRKAS